MKRWHPFPLGILLLAVSPALAAWQDAIPADIARAYLDSDRVLSETPCDWRQPIGAIFRPMVDDCTSAREACLEISSHIGEKTGVYYSMERSKPDMNALEALKEKKVSCTGQSILLVCAFRSVGLPARAVGIPTWNHVRGNHTWVEVWFEGQWHMIEFNEKEFNTPWVMENIGMLDPSDLSQHIYAVAGNETGMEFPLYSDTSPIPAEDVTERYRQWASAWYASQGLAPGTQKLMVDVVPRAQKPGTARLLDAEGHILEEKPLPSVRDDVRQFASFALPRSGIHYLKVTGSAKPMEIKPTSSPVQVLRLRLVKKSPV